VTESIPGMMNVCCRSCHIFNTDHLMQIIATEIEMIDIHRLVALDMMMAIDSEGATQGTGNEIVIEILIVNGIVITIAATTVALVDTAKDQ
jgi:hypothetical protein